jgi:dynein heavy chain, axonemal
MAKSYPSQKPLASYVADLAQRTATLERWIAKGPPIVFNLSSFFFTHAFLTAAKQNFARKHRISIEAIMFDFSCLPDAEIQRTPENGVYVTGMYIEGARWNPCTKALDESIPKVCWCKSILVAFCPILVSTWQRSGGVVA